MKKKKPKASKMTIVEDLTDWQIRQKFADYDAILVNFGERINDLDKQLENIAYKLSMVHQTTIKHISEHIDTAHKY